MHMGGGIDEQLDRGIIRLSNLIAARETIIMATGRDRNDDAKLRLLHHRLKLVKENKQVVERYLRPLRPLEVSDAAAGSHPPVPSHRNRRLPHQ